MFMGMFRGLQQQAGVAVFTLTSVCFSADHAAGQEEVGGGAAGSFETPRNTLVIPKPVPDPLSNNNLMNEEEGAAQGPIGGERLSGALRLGTPNATKETINLGPFAQFTAIDFIPAETLFVEPLNNRDVRWFWSDSVVASNGELQTEIRTVTPCNHPLFTEETGSPNLNYRYSKPTYETFAELLKRGCLRKWKDLGARFSWSKSKNGPVVSVKNPTTGAEESALVLLAERPEWTYREGVVPYGHTFGNPVLVLHSTIGRKLVLAIPESPTESPNAGQHRKRNVRDNLTYPIMN